MSSEIIAVVGLGYVGLPLAVALSDVFPTTGFDVDADRINQLGSGIDRTGEVDSEALRASSLTLTTNVDSLRSTTFFIICVPTPIDANRVPDLGLLKRAAELVGSIARPGSVVVLESTVYPGVTEGFCGPIIEQVSGLRRPKDFRLGYSPERANPGDREHSLGRVVKVVAGEDAETLERIAKVYSSIVPAGLHRAPSIKVAEAAKVIENTQRDLNIALMNELAIIFNHLGIRTRDVLAAAETKWNFLPFKPGLVGGHCIGVDPYYLTAHAEVHGYYPQIILAGRRINDGMGTFVAQQVVKQLIQAGIAVSGASVGILGLTFKENVPDTRNSRVPDILKELAEFGVDPRLHDPLISEAVAKEINISTCSLEELVDLHGLILAVPHRDYLAMDRAELFRKLRPGGIFFDIKSAIDPSEVPHAIKYWSL
jgi:UDP-N-acetyl-D-glucosamine/UDP-N-acetyl-D-galactosamine dehydrogenase